MWDTKITRKFEFLSRKINKGYKESKASNEVYFANLAEFN